MSMTDRELLELAAKAAGIQGLDFDYAEREGHRFYFGPRLPAAPGLQAMSHSYWRPLEDDGDALRLAVKLSMLCEFSCSGMTVEAPKGPGPVSEFEDYRRAIVRAAAEIGKAMQEQH